MERGNILLSTEDLSIGYGKHLLLTELNISLTAGKLVCFMGPNGIGKSTLIRTLAGLQKPVSGRVRISSDEDFPAAAVVLTDRISSAYLNVSELVAFGRYPYIKWNIKLSPADLELIDNAMRQVNITDLAEKKLHELSDGQLQLAMIARAIAQDTDIILLDEPTAHLDLNNRLEIMNLLRSLSHKMNKAILVATHELDLVLQTADEIWLAGRGKMLLTGIPEDLVLTGAFDSIFQLKGYDLKTGEVSHEVSRHKTAQIHGDGLEYRWTKNALERSGYLITKQDPVFAIKILRSTTNELQWVVNNADSFDSLGRLILYLDAQL